MELKIGDKVRFMDSVGGGTILSFKGKDMVMVLEEDGFETPALKRQCVLVESASKPVESKASPSMPQAVPKIQPTVTPKTIQQKVAETRAGEILNVSLAFLTAEGKSFQDAQFEAYLINDSNYTLMFNYASCSGKTWRSRHAGSIEPNSKLFIEEFGREDIPELEKLSLQILAYKTGSFYTFKNSFSVELRLDTVKFFKVHCFRDNDFFDEDALIVPVITNDLAEKNLLIEPEDIRRAMLEKIPEKPKGSQPLPPKNGPVEVDLHIEQLLDSTTGMDHAAILNHQLEVFRKVMDENRNKRGVKMVFIHGKGDGVLRSAIVKELQTKYNTCRYQDASFREYGYGATMVIMS